jgi:ral guanine nucleotide dissociation stimulator
LCTWLNKYVEDFIQPPDFPCLKKLIANLHLNMPGLDEECLARILLTHLEHQQISKVEPLGEEVGAETQST